MQLSGTPSSAHGGGPDQRDASGDGASVSGPLAGGWSGDEPGGTAGVGGVGPSDTGRHVGEGTDGSGGPLVRTVGRSRLCLDLGTYGTHSFVFRAAAPPPLVRPAVVEPNRGSPLPRWVRQFWFGVLAGGLPPPGGRARSWAPGERSASVEDSLRALPQPPSWGCAIAAVLVLPRRVRECEVCGRSLRGRQDVRCEGCGCRLCDTFCVRLCHRAARFNTRWGGLNELARGCAARFCARCEPSHICLRIEPQRVAGWKCSPAATQPAPQTFSPPSQVTGDHGPHRHNSCPPGGGRVASILGPLPS